MHLVLQARAKLRDNKVNGPEDAVVGEMIKILLVEKMYTIARCFQDRFYGSDGCSQLVEDCETGFLAEARRRTKERESGVTEQLRSPASCRSGTRLV